MSRLKQHEENHVIERVDGRKLVRVYAYLSVDTEKKLKNYCFRNGENVSDFVDDAVARQLKRVTKRKAAA